VVTLTVSAADWMVSFASSSLLGPSAVRKGYSRAALVMRCLDGNSLHGLSGEVLTSI
jgi:hypothetical protein